MKEFLEVLLLTALGAAGLLLFKVGEAAFFTDNTELILWGIVVGIFGVILYLYARSRWINSK